MKTSCFVLVALLFASMQKLSGQISGGSGTTRTQFEYGITNFHPWQLNSRFQQNGFPGFTQFRTAGLGFTGNVLTHAASDWDCSIAFHIMLPEMRNHFSDSSSVTARGWELMTSLYGFDIFSEIKEVDLVVAPGVYWGSLKWREEIHVDENTRYMYKNPFVAPMLRVDLRLNVRKFSFGARYSFRYDITKSTWKNKEPTARSLPGYKFREAQYMFYIGYSFRKNNDAPTK